MMRRRSNGSGISSIHSDDVESGYLLPTSVDLSKSKRKGKSFCWTFFKRLVYLGIFCGLIYFAWTHFQRAYALYSLPGVTDMLNEIPRVLGEDYVVFLTASSGKPGETVVKMAKSQKSPVHALILAHAKLPKRHYPWIKIDAVDEIETIKQFDYFNALDAPGAWFGIAFDWKQQWAFLPEEVFAAGMLDREAVLRWEKIISYARAKGLKGWPVPEQGDDNTHMEGIDVFHTQSVFYNLEESTNAIPIYHGHRMYEKITPELLRAQTIQAGRYMIELVNDKGNFLDLYHPRSDFKRAGYDYARHAASIYSMSRLYQKWNDSTLLQAMKRAMDMLVKQVQSCPVLDNPKVHAKCIILTDDGQKFSKMGANALTVLAIAEYMEATQDKSHYNTAKELSAWIVGGQRDDGFLIHQVNLPDFNPAEHIFIRYYQGQTAFGLSRLYNVAKRLNLSPDEKWIDVAVKATKHMTTKDQQSHDGAFFIDHWLLLGISEMPESRSNDFMDHVLRSIRVAHENHEGELEDEEELDRLGLFFEDISAAVTATVSEGLCAVYPLTVKQKKSTEATKQVVEAVTMAMRHQLQTQYHPEDAMYMKNPRRILGGFHESVINSEMRIDYTYHNVCGMICAADMLEAEMNTK